MDEIGNRKPSPKRIKLKKIVINKNPELTFLTVSPRASPRSPRTGPVEHTTPRDFSSRDSSKDSSYSAHSSRDSSSEDQQLSLEDPEKQIPVDLEHALRMNRTINNHVYWGIESFEYFIQALLLLKAMVFRHTPDFPAELLSLLLHNLYWIKNEFRNPYLSTGASHAMIIINGELFSCGNNHKGQLGSGFFKRVLNKKPRAKILHQHQWQNIGTPNKYRWTLVACGGAHTLAYSQQLGLFGWGRCEGGALGMGHTVDAVEDRPKRVDFPHVVRAIACGNQHSILCTDEGVYSSGCNANGQLGVGDNVDRSTFARISLEACGFRDGTARRHSRAPSPRTDSNANGANSKTATNTNASAATSASPVHRGNLSPSVRHAPPAVVSLGCGYSFCALITEATPLAPPFPLAPTAMPGAERLLYVWGNNECGQLGLEDHQSRDKPTCVPLSFLARANGLTSSASSTTSLPNRNNSAADALLSLACGAFYMMLVTTGGHLYATGANAAGQLGLNDTHERSTFARVALDGVLSVACGAFHTMALTREHGVYAWGRNSYGQLGVGDCTDRHAPCRIGLIDQPLFCISLGTDYTILLTDKGVLYSGKFFSTRFDSASWDNRPVTLDALSYHSISFKFAFK